MTTAASLRLVGFRVAGGMILMPAAAVAAMLPEGPETGDLPTIQELIGLRPDRVSPCRILVLRGRSGECRAVVPGDVVIVELSAGDIHPPPPLLAATTGVRGLAALAPVGNEMALVVDPARAF